MREEIASRKISRVSRIDELRITHELALQTDLLELPRDGWPLVLGAAAAHTRWLGRGSRWSGRRCVRRGHREHRHLPILRLVAGIAAVLLCEQFFLPGEIFGDAPVAACRHGGLSVE